VPWGTSSQDGPSRGRRFMEVGLAEVGVPLPRCTPSSPGRWLRPSTLLRRLILNAELSGLQGLPSVGGIPHTQRYGSSSGTVMWALLDGPQPLISSKVSQRKGSSGVNFGGLA
jgi:hypothetical protein